MKHEHCLSLGKGCFWGHFFGHGYGYRYGYRYGLGLLSLLLSAVLVGCGGGSSQPNAPQNAANTYLVSGSVSGLASGTQVTLGLYNQSLLVSPLTLTGNAASSMGYSFPIGLTSGSPYSVSITSTPSGVTCNLSNPSGLVGSSAVTNVNLNCYTPQLAISPGFGVFRGPSPVNGSGNAFYSVWLPGSSNSNALFYGIELLSANVANLYSAQATLAQGSGFWQFVGSMNNETASAPRSGAATLSVNSSTSTAYAATVNLTTPSNLPGLTLNLTGNKISTSTTSVNGTWTGTWLENANLGVYNNSTVTLTGATTGASTGSTIGFAFGSCSSLNASTLNPVAGLSDVFTVTLYFSAASGSNCGFASDTPINTPFNGVAFVYLDPLTSKPTLQLMAVNSAGRGVSFKGI